MTSRRRRFVTGLAVAVLLFVGLRLLERIVAPGVMPADAGEFQLVARDLGVAHPPGYPLYTMAAHLFGRLVNVAPVGTLFGARLALDVSHDCHIAGAPCVYAWTWGVNLFSAVLALATLVVVGATVVRLVGSLAAGVLGAVTLALTPTFLAQSTVANIRMPTALFTALLLYLTVVWLEHAASPPGPKIMGGERTGSLPIDRHLVVLAFVFGLAAGHHGSLIFLGVPIAIVVLWQRPGLIRDWRTLVAMAMAFMISLLPLLYLPIRDRAGAVLATGNLGTVSGFLYHVTAAGFKGDVFYFDDWMTLWDRVLVLANILVIQFGIALLLAVVGAAWLVRTRPKAACLLGGAMVVMSALAITYRAPQTMEYLLPAYVAIAMLAGASGAVVRRLVQLRFELAAAARNEPEPAWRRPVVEETVILLVALMVSLPRLTLPAKVHEADEAQAPPVAVLHDRREGDTILANWHFATPLWYAARHLILRPDLDIQYVHPEGAEPIGATWLRRLEATASPTVLTNRTPQMIKADVPLWPVSATPFFATVPEPCSDAPRCRHVGVDFGQSVRLEWLRLDHSWPQSVATTLHVKALAPITETLTLVTQLIDHADGRVLGQIDHGFSPARWNHPDGLTDRLVILPFRGELPISAQLTVGLYRSTPAGPERLAVAGRPALVLDEWSDASWDINGQLPLPPPGQIPFGRAMTLVGSKVRQVDEDTLLVDLTWLAEEAYTSDYTISVQVQGDGWTAQDDGTPAQGAIPTLKWLPGMVIHDRHRIPLPPDRPPDGPYRVTVGLYDAFSLEPVPITDAERVRAGQGQAAEVYRAP